LTESTVTSKYQVTIPKKIRQSAGIEVGDVLVFEERDDHILFRKKKFSRLSEGLPLPGHAKVVEDVHEWREVAKKRSSRRNVA
jgi:AbrB family looped-hinge helix DNA binding protein